MGRDVLHKKITMALGKPSTPKGVIMTPETVERVNEVMGRLGYIMGPTYGIR